MKNKRVALSLLGTLGIFLTGFMPQSTYKYQNLHSQVTPMERFSNTPIPRNPHPKVANIPRDLLVPKEEKTLHPNLATLSFFPSLLPVQGVISSRFGTRLFHTKRKHGKAHKGIDIAAPRGSTVVASASGTVKAASFHHSYGWMVIIAHGEGLLTRYAHNSKLLTKVGSIVHKGEAIAKVGSSGRATGAHLHFEVILNNKPVDPESFLDNKNPVYAKDKVIKAKTPSLPALHPQILNQPLFNQPTVNIADYENRILL